MKPETFKEKIDRVWQFCEREGELEKLIDRYNQITKDMEEGYEYDPIELIATIRKINANEEFIKVTLLVARV